MSRKFQERSKENLKKQQQKEHQDALVKLDEDSARQEEALKKQMQDERDKILREKKNKQAAELAARNDLTEEKLAAVSYHLWYWPVEKLIKHITHPLDALYKDIFALSFILND